MDEECIYLTEDKDRWGYGNIYMGDACASIHETFEIVRICVNNNGEQMNKLIKNSYLLFI
jgi:hypothetical protein